MKNKLKTLSILIAAMAFVALNVAMIQKANEPWDIPAKYKTMKSTIKAGDPSINTVGKELYNQHCRSCHGTKGLGDGPKAKNLKTSCGDFSSKAFQDQADGVIYYQSFVGRDEMPNFEKKITDEGDRWAVVYYMRTLKK
ncbi:MAG: cytochrome c [Lentimicrobium sp.]|jgi:mono/diheme cytochrome c family protein|nr:cytochrome c [Lentimicrobium sp.]